MVAKSGGWSPYLPRWQKGHPSVQPLGGRLNTRGFTEEFDIMTGKALIALGFIIVLSQTPLSSGAETLSVPSNYSTIKAACKVARVGDRIELAPGIYKENRLILPSGIALVGLGAQPADVVIDGENIGRLILCESLVHSSFIENITLANGHANG